MILIAKNIQRHLFLLGFQFEVTVVSAMANQKQTRGIFKIKFNDQDEDTELFE
jgi:hypothetical protein